MAKVRAAQYVDSRFRKYDSHILLKGVREPVTVYCYEARNALHTIAVLEDKRFVCTTGGEKVRPSPTHREIDKHFNLNLKLEN